MGFRIKTFHKHIYENQKKKKKLRLFFYLRSETRISKE